MKRFLLCSAFALSLCVSAQADEGGKSVRHLVTGIGLKDCNFYLNADSEDMKMLVVNWVQGFISGSDGAMSAVAKDEILFNKVSSSEEVLTEFDAICRANRDMTIDHAASVTFLRLAQQ